jgi:hypothetical protein
LGLKGYLKHFVGLHLKATEKRSAVYMNHNKSNLDEQVSDEQCSTADSDAQSSTASSDSDSENDQSAQNKRRRLLAPTSRPCTRCGILPTGPTHVLYQAASGLPFADIITAFLTRLTILGVYSYVHRNRTRQHPNDSWAPVQELPVPFPPILRNDQFDFAAPTKTVLDKKREQLNSLRSTMNPSDLRDAEQELNEHIRILAYACNWYSYCNRKAYAQHLKEFTAENSRYQRDKEALTGAFRNAFCSKTLQHVQEELSNHQYATAFYKLVDYYA